ncbi:hypothetical protein GW17_00025488 [Ensete ventricosum]|nr:hypothetical protein GW17_00025488 [Ensete ventricosum]
MRGVALCWRLPCPWAIALAAGVVALGQPPLRAGVILVGGTSTGTAPMGVAPCWRSLLAYKTYLYLQAKMGHKANQTRAAKPTGSPLLAVQAATRPFGSQLLSAAVVE